MSLQARKCIDKIFIVGVCFAPCQAASCVSSTAVSHKSSVANSSPLPGSGWQSPDTFKDPCVKLCGVLHLSWDALVGCGEPAVGGTVEELGQY